MRWLRRARGEPAPAPPRPAPALPPPETHPAPALQLALGRLPRSGATVVDLGPALAANVAMFQRLGARLRILDLAAAVDEAGLAGAPAGSWDAAAPRLVPVEEGSVDLVLAWDLPNYFGREGWLAIARRLVASLAPSGALHALIRVMPAMPARPSRFRLLEDGTLSEERTAADTIPAPRFPAAEVERLHPGLVAPHSFLGRHGVQEYVLEPAAAHDFPARPVARRVR